MSELNSNTRIPQLSPEGEMLVRKRQLSPIHQRMMELLRQDNIGSIEEVEEGEQPSNNLMRYLNQIFTF
jgi:hypothetical protein